jgi:hypothetical protein
MSSYDMRMLTTPSRLPGTASSRYLTTSSKLIGRSPIDISQDGSSIFMRDDTNTRVRVVNLESGDVDTYGLTKPALLRAREEALLNLVGFLIPTKNAMHTPQVYEFSVFLVSHDHQAFTAFCIELTFVHDLQATGMSISHCWNIPQIKSVKIAPRPHIDQR